MHEQTPSHPPARDPDWQIKWFIGSMVVGVFTNVISSKFLDQIWALLPPALFVAALLVVVPKTGLLRPERHGETRWAGVLALIALAGYLAVAWWGAYFGWPTSLAILSVAFLWGAGVAITWSIVRDRIGVGEVGMASAMLLVGPLFALFGISGLVDAWKSMTSPDYFIIAELYLLVGTGVLMAGAAMLLGRWSHGRIFGLLFAVAILLPTFFGGPLIYVPPLWITASLVITAAILLLWLAALLKRSWPAGVALLLVAVVATLPGVATLLQEAWPLPIRVRATAATVVNGVAVMLGAVAVLKLKSRLATIATPLERSRLVGVSIVLFGLSYLSVADIQGDTTPVPSVLVSAALIIFGIAWLLAGFVIFYPPGLLHRVRTSLNKRRRALRSKSDPEDEPVGVSEG